MICSSLFSQLLLVFYSYSIVVVVLAVAPVFDRPSENVTVIIGSGAVLPCVITSLGDHKVAWIKVANMDILAIGDYKVTNDERIRLLAQSGSQGSSYSSSDWSLSIQSVNEDDSGEYICQVNTEPQMISRIYLNVLLPPKIIEEKSTLSPSPFKEGSTLKLHCHSEGQPAPRISWYFRKRHETSQHVAARTHQRHHDQPLRPDHIVHEGDTLVIHNVTRLHSGSYECIANNSVPPAASRKFKVIVEFPPEIHVHSGGVVEYQLGQSAHLECRIRANPLSNFYWMRNDRVIENSQVSFHHDNTKSSGGVERKSAKYETVVHSQNSYEYLTVISLTVKNLVKSDLGKYYCFAVNGLNTTKAEIEVREAASSSRGRGGWTSTKQAVSKILVYSNQATHGVGQQYDLLVESNRAAANANKNYPRKIANSNGTKIESTSYDDQARSENSLNLLFNDATVFRPNLVVVHLLASTCLSISLSFL